MKKNFLLLLFLPAVLFGQDLPLIEIKVLKENIDFSKTIIVEDLERHLNILASDSLEGRETGKPGQKMAADYIMNHFNNIGIQK